MDANRIEKDRIQDRIVLLSFACLGLICFAASYICKLVWKETDGETVQQVEQCNANFRVGSPLRVGKCFYGTIIEYAGHEYLASPNGSYVHVESCKCKTQIGKGN